MGRASNSIAEVAGGRLQLYKSTTHAKFLIEREERQARVRSTIEAQERERKRMQGFIDRSARRLGTEPERIARVGSRHWNAWTASPD